MQWINALSTRPSLEAAVNEVVEAIQAQLSTPAQLGLVFLSSTFASDYPRLVPLLLEKLPLPVLLGCGGAGIVGMKGTLPLEIEQTPALSLMVASLPDVTVQPFQINPDQLPDLDSPPQQWWELLEVAPESNPHFLLLCDPMTSGLTDLLAGLDFAYPQSVKIGGLASSNIHQSSGNLFFFDQRRSSATLYPQGIIGVALWGNLWIDTVVAQGCRPIGEPIQIHQGERNIITEVLVPQDNREGLVARPPLDVLRELVQTLSEADQKLAQESLFVGLAMDEFKMALQAGDFLIRNLLGVDPRHGAIAIGDRVRPGQRLQFHLRDARTSAEDLTLLLDNYRLHQVGHLLPKGALMFSCLGRGESLYGKPNFDAELFRHYLPQVSLGGFFCNGEIGPVGNSTFLHGYTSAFAIFRPLY